MSSHENQRRSFKIPALRVALAGALLAVALFLRLRNAWTDLDALSRSTLPDDAFYYFGIARNLALGHPPSIDGIHPTNGFHPLWAALLVPFYLLGDPSDLRTPIHAALTLGALLDVVAGVLLFYLTGLLRYRMGVRLLALGWFALDPYRVLQATSGMETPLALAFILGLVILHLQARRPHASKTGRSPWLFGLIAGGAILARTDSVVLVMALLFARAIAERRPPEQRAERGSRWLGTAISVSIVVILPWLIYSMNTTGTIVQSSGLALSVVAKKMPEIWGLEQVSMKLHIERLVASSAEGIALTLRFFGLSRMPAVMLLAFAVTTFALAKGRKAKLLGGQLRCLMPLCLAMAALFLAHTMGRMVFREWYTAPFVLALFLLMTAGIDSAVRQTRWPRILLFIVSIVCAWGLSSAWMQWEHYGLYRKADYRGMIPNPDLREGHSDCGAVSYFTMGGVTNLDGVVNQGALDLLVEGRLLEYLMRKRFRRVYVTDHFHSAIFFGPRYRESLRTDRGDVRAVRLIRSDAEKNALIRLRPRPVSLGGVAGREYLSDGWLWLTKPPRVGFVQSIGHRSEIIFSLSEVPEPEEKLAIKLAASVVNERGVQPVDVFLNEKHVAKLRVRRDAQRHLLPLDRARVGRNRLRLEYGAARPVRSLGFRGFFDWWRSLRGNMVSAVAANDFWISRTKVPALPPEGPPLSDPAADEALEEGWHNVDRSQTPAAVWAIAERAVLSFWVSTPQGKLTLVIAAGPPPESHGRTHQTMRVIVNGKLQGTVLLRPGAIESHRIALQPGALRFGKNRVMLKFKRFGIDPVSGTPLTAFVQGISLQ